MQCCTKKEFYFYVTTGLHKEKKKTAALLDYASNQILIRFVPPVDVVT